MARPGAGRCGRHAAGGGGGGPAGGVAGRGAGTARPGEPGVRAARPRWCPRCAGCSPTTRCGKSCGRCSSARCMGPAARPRRWRCTSRPGKDRRGARRRPRRRAAAALPADPGRRRRAGRYRLAQAGSGAAAARRARPASRRHPDFTGRSGQVEQLRELLAGAAAATAAPVRCRWCWWWARAGRARPRSRCTRRTCCASQFPDGQLYANLLGATQPADPAEVLARFLARPGHRRPRGSRWMRRSVPRFTGPGSRAAGADRARRRP